MTQTTTRISKEGVLARIEHAVEKEAFEVDLTNCEFEEFNLSDMTIPVSLDCQNSIFRSPVIICRSKLAGSFLEFTGAEIHQGIFLNGLQAVHRLDHSISTGQGFGLYLRKAKIWGAIEIQDSGPLSGLCIGGNQYHKYKQEQGIFRLAGTNIMRGMWAITDEEEYV